MLAVAGEKGVSRDKLLAMLWPDGDPDKSRHALNQILSAQRRHFADSELFDGKKTIRLNRALISSDVSDFEHALSSADLDAAVEIYSGPFLDGFFVPDSTEFEKWVSDQRDRFAARLSDALDNAAKKAEGSADLEVAIRRRRQCAAIDRIDASRALKLADVLARAGNRAGALKSLQECQRRIKDELGFSDPLIAERMSALAAELDGRS
jgi:DNA-binding SARP family transcriptional activator